MVKKVEKVGTTLDIGATLLPFLGYNAQLGLSRNLLGEDISLKATFDNSFDQILSAWTKEIGRFWEFPKIEQDAVLNSNKNNLKIGSTLYKSPILLRLRKFGSKPFFEVKIKFFETAKLFGYLHDHHANDAFWWVDKCSLTSSIIV